MIENAREGPCPCSCSSEEARSITTCQEASGFGAVWIMGPIDQGRLTRKQGMARGPTELLANLKSHSRRDGDRRDSCPGEKD
jgi:hypothetical protein